MGKRLLKQVVTSLAMVAIAGSLWVTTAPPGALPSADAHAMCNTTTHYHERVGTQYYEKWVFRNVTRKYLGSYLSTVYVWDVYIINSNTGNRVNWYTRETAC